MSKTVKIILGVLALIIAVALTGYLWSYRTDAITYTSELAPASTVTLGEQLEQTITITIPICGKIGLVQVAPPENIVVSGEPKVAFECYKWSSISYKITTTLSPIIPQESPEGSTHIAVELPQANRKIIEVAIPKITVMPNQNSHGKLDLAGAITPQTHSSKMLWIVIAAIIVALGLALYLWRNQTTKAKVAKVIPPWEDAKLALYSLKNEITSHKISLEFAFVKLTDLVRIYLERRYNLPASSLTTDEFLEELQSDQTALPKDERPFLYEFMAVAELVKFAKLPPNEAQLLDAVERAEALVTKTTPNQEEDK